MKYFSFSVFHYKSEFYKKGRYYIVSTKDICVRMRNGFVLGNKEIIVNEESD